MPKYICDIEAVREQGQALISSAEAEVEALKKLSKAGKKYLSSASWEGFNKDTFAVTYEKVGNYAGGNALSLRNLGLFIIL